MKLYLMLSSIVLFSCHNNKQDKLSSGDSAIVSNSQEFNHSQIEILYFKEYWKEFGIAIQTEDTNKIKLLVESPLVIEGREDQDPRLIINSNDIVKYVMFAVNHGGYYDLEKDTSISNKTLLLSELKNIPEYKKETNSQWIHDFVFEKTAHGWKLVTLYMDTKNLGNKLK